MIIGLYITFIILSQFFATKIFEITIFGHKFYSPSGIILFSITYLMIDIVNEHFGYKTAKKIIFIALISQIAMSFFIWIVIQLKPAPFWQYQSIWENIFSTVPRITLASWIAFYISSYTDAFLYSNIKKITKDKYLWIRNSFSTIPSLLIDSILFITIAFYGNVPIINMIIGQTIIKWIIGIINIPFIYLNVYILRKN